MGASVWECTCGSPAAAPAAPPSAPPLALFPSPYGASSALAARALTSGTSAGADWADWRVRESGSAVQLSSYSGNRVSHPAGGRREGERSSAPSPGPSAPDTRRVHFSANSLPPLLPPKLWPFRESGILPSTPVPHARRLPPRETATNHSDRQRMSCLVTNPRAPGGGD